MLSAHLVEEFQIIAREEFGFEMNEADAAKAAVWLVTYLDELARRGDGELRDPE